MPPYAEFSDDELPDLKALILPRNNPSTSDSKLLRRSPRKNATSASWQERLLPVAQASLSATSNQRRLSPAKKSPSKRSTLRTLPQTAATASLFDGVPTLPRTVVKSNSSVSASNRQSLSQTSISLNPTEDDPLLVSLSTLAVQSDTSDAELAISRQPKWKKREKSAMSLQMEIARNTTSEKPRARNVKETQRASRFVLDEARCNEDLVDPEAEDEGEEEDTDLSGFIVDDDVEISYQESAEEVDSEEERRSRRKMQPVKPKRRLQRGRKKIMDSEDEVDSHDELSKALNNMQLIDSQAGRRAGKEVEVIDLISPEHKVSDDKPQYDDLRSSKASGINLFDKFKALRLSPPRSSQSSDFPSKMQPTTWPSSSEESYQDEPERQDQFTTPPVTPPRSPSKLKSPSKLLSPSKRGDGAQRSPHRQSMDAFWDLNKVNEWHDQFSPKKAPVQSPSKNRLAALDMWSDGEEDSFEAINESSDSLPSPCESPTKLKSRSASPIKVEKQRHLAEKRAKQAEKKQFDERKDQMAKDLLQALDKNITGSRISKFSASTGGVQVIWSKTLRSTAGRANWRRTVTKSTGSPVKGKAEEYVPGSTIHHFANIELAIKVVDRQDRLINTLAHEFCHLANFMVSGIRDQPHGASFQNWARKVTVWMKSQDEVPEWRTVEVTTKHGYVIEWKYLWLCVGREKTKAMEFLNIEEEDGCGAEYGRHSKSIDTETQRCGRCKGRLAQIRPRPRASPIKKTATAMTRSRKMIGKGKSAGNQMGGLEKMVEIVELSD